MPTGEYIAEYTGLRDVWEQQSYLAEFLKEQVEEDQVAADRAQAAADRARTAADRAKGVVGRSCANRAQLQAEADRAQAVADRACADQAQQQAAADKAMKDHTAKKAGPAAGTSNRSQPTAKLSINLKQPA